MELVSMVVPLDTLAGWPTAPPVSALELLALLVGAPVLVIALVFAIGSVTYRDIWQPGPRPGQSLVIGGDHSHDRITGNPTPAQLERAGASPEPDLPTGGASARW